MNDHTEMIAYENMNQTVETLTKMTRDPNTYTVDQFADISRSVLDLIAALNSKIEHERQLREFANDDSNAELEDLQKKYRAVRMELELERGRVKSLKATVVNQAEHITHLSALNISAEHDRAVRMAREDAFLFDEENYNEL